jgi:hypothetical protein
MTLTARAIIVPLLFLPFMAYSQQNSSENDPRKSNIIEQRIEFLAEVLEQEDLDYTTVFEDLSWYFDHPVNLNDADAELLRRLYILDDFQIAALLEYRRKYRDFLTIYELGLVKGIDPTTIGMILPFVKVEPSAQKDKLTLQRVLKYGRNDMFLRYQRVLEPQEGFKSIDDSTLAANPNKRYLGNPDKYYLRYRFRFGDRIMAGITAEKDPGEEFFKGSQKRGFDFYSAHFFYRGSKILRQLAIGDFQVEFGQGLTAWSGLAFGKSALLSSMKRNGQGLRPSASAEENLFLRGAGVTLQTGPVKYSVFASHKKIDANVLEDTTLEDDGVIVSSFQTSGLHRTPGELDDRNSIGETHAGAHVEYGSEHAEIGITGIYSQYAGNLNRSLDVYNQFALNSNSSWNVGADYLLMRNHFQFFGETALSGNTMTVANMHGVKVDADNRLKLVFLYRHLPMQYQASLGNAIAESSTPQNETGLLTGAEILLNRNMTLTGYIDHFSSKWLRYRTDAPSKGVDYLVQLNYNPRRSVQTYLRVRFKQKQINDSEITEGLHTLVDQEKLNVRLHGSFTPDSRFTFKSRLEWVYYQKSDEEMASGFLLYQDVTFRSEKLPLTVTGRFALFDSDSYDSRLYAYENDVLYAFSIPAYYYRGSRFYLVFKYEPVRNMDVWLRIGQWYYSNQNQVGSDLSLIEGRSKTEIKVQIRIRF